MAAWRKIVGAGMIMGALAVAAVPTFAGDQSRGLFVGFSDDGKYCAFETIGVQDGSGFPYATMFVIDVAANDWATDPFSVVLKTTGDTLPCFSQRPRPGSPRTRCRLRS